MAAQVEDALIRARPDLHTKITDTVEATALKLADRKNDLNNDIARVWAKAYSEEELKTLTAFFKSSAGQKYLTQGLASTVAGGWSLQWIATVQDGQPFTVPCSVTTAAGSGCNALKVPGESLYAGPHNAVHILNAAAFANPSASATGLAVLGGSPTQATGPAYRRLDLSLFRKIALADQV